MKPKLNEIRNSIILIFILLFLLSNCSKAENDNQLNDSLPNYTIAYCYQPVDNSGLHQIYTINADEWGGQSMFVFPELEMIVVFNCGNYLQNGSIPIFPIVENYILKAVNYYE